jgi:hypothetical protein
MADGPTLDEPQFDPPSADPSPPCTYLADLKPIETDGIERHDDAIGTSVRIAGRQHRQAICVKFAPDDDSAQFAFSLKGEYARLQGAAGLADRNQTAVDNEEPPAAGQDLPAASFFIYADANLLWSSKPLAGAGAVESFEVDVTGVDVLTFVVQKELATSVVKPVWTDLRLSADVDDESP